VAIVDYGLGNLFSVKHACEYVGMQATITSSKEWILSSDAVILPGVGAFGDAMKSLRQLDLIGPLKEVVGLQKPLIGICLGMQLLMTESYEFGRHSGLGIIDGPVVRFDDSVNSPTRLKVPQIGWNRILRRRHRQVEGESDGPNPDSWSGSPLEGLPDETFMFFVHSFYAMPVDSNLVLAVSEYGNIEFCSSIRYGNTFSFQFHPERSGSEGLRIYRNLASLIQKQMRRSEG
jgi:glutamine amidotransferase